MQTPVTFFRRSAEFILMVSLIYVTYIPCGVYHEKILKAKYLLSGDDTSTPYPDTLIFTFIAPFIAWILASLIIKFKGTQIQNTEIPVQSCLACGMLVVVNNFTANQAILTSSYSTIIMIKSCTLLSVIMVGVFCSRVADRNLQIGKQKLLVGLLVTIGIFIFNYYHSEEIGSSDKNLQLMSIFWVTVSLFGDGFLPDIQAEIKSKYKPSSLAFSRQINYCVFMITLLLLIFTLRLQVFVDFFLRSGQFRVDILMYAALNTAGQQVVYMMINRFRQHIAPMVIMTRKCFTVVANILYFSHPIRPEQMVGIAIVFLSLAVEVYLNNQAKSTSTIAKAQQLEKRSAEQAIEPAIENQSNSTTEFDSPIKMRQNL